MQVQVCETHLSPLGECIIIIASEIIFKIVLLVIQTTNIQKM